MSVRLNSSGFSKSPYDASSPRQGCCKQKTYGLAKPFRCKTYKKHGGWPPDDRRFRPVGQGAYLERPSGTRDSASAAASWCRLSAGENHVQVQTSIVVAASSGMDFAGEGAVRAHGPQTDCRCGRQTAPSSRYKPGQLDGARGIYVAVPGRPAIS